VSWCGGSKEKQPAYKPPLPRFASWFLALAESLPARSMPNHAIFLHNTMKCHFLSHFLPILSWQSELGIAQEARFFIKSCTKPQQFAQALGSQQLMVLVCAAL
jgi:hypothetical protein